MRLGHYNELLRQAEVQEKHRQWKAIESLRKDFVIETGEQPFEEVTKSNIQYTFWLEKRVTELQNQIKKQES